MRTQNYRLGSGGELYDMVADPEQKQNIAQQKPDLAEELRAAVAEWKKEVLPKGKDDRPYPVGYAQFPITPLPARDGVAHRGVKRSSGAPNCSYFVNWTKLEDTITWDVDVHTTGDYEVVIHYTCPEADAGSTVELSLDKQRLRGKVTPGWDPPLYNNQDTIPRPNAESTMKEFRPLELGTIHLEQGRGTLQLQAVEIPGNSVMDVRFVACWN